MLTPIKNFLLSFTIHVINNKSVVSQLETYWVCNELALHGRYSPFLFETQMRRDFTKHLKTLLVSTLILLVCGLVLCSYQSLLVQWLGVVVCLLGSTGLLHIGCKKMLAHKAKNAGKALGELA